MSVSSSAVRPIRWAIVGSGGIARRTVGDLRLCPEARLVAICSRSRERADAFAAEHGLPLAFDDYTALCASPEVDAVYIGTPHATHFALARQALVAGKHVLCEKPLTMTADEARTLGRLAAEHGVLVMEAMWMKFSPAMQRAVELVREGVIGQPRFLQAGLGYPVPANGPARFWDPALGGGALYDMGVYLLTLAQMFLGEPEEVRVTGQMRPDGVDLAEAITLRYAGGAMAQLATSIIGWMPPRGWLGGDGGAIDFQEPLFSPGGLKVSTGRPPAPPQVQQLDFPREGAGYAPMFRAAHQAIRAGQTEHPQHPVAATAAVLDLMQRVQALMAVERDAGASAGLGAGSAPGAEASPPGARP
ncbi:Gfo/Idh/MocA family protein [Ideonella livida]|uniref:Gfo/Idh/MocA family oxidoreductase n=1 Tax=Ideonella livida TaxID=2707176 RepID=A0A7C9PHH3_9BURK|nr:Gfo/Idh/MocA family oxidoreductase [Ideonella livida]NDY91868.1 Gfo/Idh/MocA family oxidoreductase [Ideonella livida]